MKDNMRYVTKGFSGFNLLRAETHIDTCKGHSKAWLIVMLLAILISGCNGNVNLSDVPTVSITSPADKATGVATNAKISSAFSMPMDSKTIDSPETTFTLKQGDTIVPGTVALASDNITAVFTPSTALVTGTTYTATITTGAKSEGGTALESDFVWTFTTGAELAVTLTSPADGATGVAVNTLIVAAFNTVIDPATVTTTTFTLTQAGTTVPGTVALSTDGSTATFTPTNNLSSNTSYTATITTGVKDLAGNALESSKTWTFKTVTAGALSVSPASLTFDSRTVGTTSSVQTVTMTNTGNTDLIVNSIINSNTTDFGLAAPATPLTITAGGNQTFTVAFKPATAGAKTATITVTSTAGNATINALGTGVATAGALSVSPAALTFDSRLSVAGGGTQSLNQTVTMTNTGDASLTVNSITNSNTTDFVLGAIALPLTINAGASQTFTVAFQPATPGDKTATITVTSTAGIATVTANGTGL